MFNRIEGNENLHNLCSSPNIITVIKYNDMAGTCSHIRTDEIWVTKANMEV